MLKALNLPSFWNYGNPGGYMWPGYSPEARAFVRESRTDAVIFWGPRWVDLEPTPGANYLGAYADADATYAAVVADGQRPFIAISSEYPLWSYAQRATRLGKAGRSARLAPDDLSPTGPWAQFIARIMRRYPRATPIVLNEPNFGFCDDFPNMAKQTAQMIKTAARVASAQRCSHILAPAMADTPNPCHFTEKVLKALNWPWGKLRGWRPPRNVSVGWAHHPYDDIKRGDTRGVQQVLDLLAKYKWHSGRKIWLTEGGYVYDTHQLPNSPYYADPAFWEYKAPLAHQEGLQALHVGHHFNWCKRSGEVMLWANYEYQDSLWSGWASGLVQRDGRPHPAHHVWQTL